MQSVLGGSLHKNNTSYLLLGLYHASVNRISIVLMQIPPKQIALWDCASSQYSGVNKTKIHFLPLLLSLKQQFNTSYRQPMHSLSFFLRIS